MNLKQKHAVAVAEKAVLLPDRVGISGQYHLPARFLSRKSADEHKERGFRQVEIGEETADNLEFVAWTQKNAGLTGMS